MAKMSLSGNYIPSDDCEILAKTFLSAFTERIPQFTICKRLYGGTCFYVVLPDGRIYSKWTYAAANRAAWRRAGLPQDLAALANKSTGPKRRLVLLAKLLRWLMNIFEGKADITNYPAWLDTPSATLIADEVFVAALADGDINIAADMMLDESEYAEEARLREMNDAVKYIVWKLRN
jgi:hypothetical protein